MHYTKEELNKSGVYSILNLINGKQYIGSTSMNFKIRWYRHLYKLKLNKHEARHLQDSFNLYGENMFAFIIIETCNPKECLIREQHYINTLQVCNREFGYNSCPTAGNNRGRKLSEETKAKIGNANRNRVVSQETRNKLSKIHKGNKHSLNHKHTQETRNKMSQSKKGKTFTEEHKQNISKAKKNKIVSQKTRDSMSKAFRKTHYFLNPQNEVIVVENLKEFCKDNNFVRIINLIIVV